MVCSGCKAPETRSGGNRYCKACHAKYMRKWRSKHVLSEEQRLKDNCRSYAHVYLRRGKLERRPCRECGEEKSQMHHPDYTKPLLIVWLCRSCHLRLHREQERRAVKSVTRETIPAGFTQRKTFFP